MVRLDYILKKWVLIPGDRMMAVNYMALVVLVFILDRALNKLSMVILLVMHYLLLDMLYRLYKYQLALLYNVMIYGGFMIFV